MADNGKALAPYEVWFLVGSQDLYGDAILAQVDVDAREIVAALDASPALPVRVVYKPVVISPAAIHQTCVEAHGAPNCVGVIAWMHTFSPAKMWIAGLRALQKPLLHLHTQFNSALPWSEIDMDYMNLHQSAHGDREFGFIQTRLGIARKTVVGHWRDPAVQERIGGWSRAACGWREAQTLNVARFGDNMREVAVTEGDKVEAQARLGLAVNGYGVGDLVASIGAVSEATVNGLLAEYERAYTLAPELRAAGARRESLIDAARIEGGLRSFLESHGCHAFTDTFEDLHGMTQLPGLAAQRLMADGYGFAGEGDWKTAALVRILKVMATGLEGGTSFMEDYTYDFAGDQPLVLGSHMLEICPSIADGKPSCELHPLGIGGHDDPVRLVFNASAGPAVVFAMVDLGDRFRLILNEVDVIPPPQPLPKLPVARAVWKPKPDFATAAEAWLVAGGPHHTVFTAALDAEVLSDFATIAGIELLPIDDATKMRDFRNEVRWNQAAYRLSQIG